jgi:hypothetical protein
MISKKTHCPETPSSKAMNLQESVEKEVVWKKVSYSGCGGFQKATFLARVHILRS